MTDLSKEPEATYQAYGEDARKGGTFANSCLMARRLVERGVRFVQIYHRGWDVHGNLPEVLPTQCKDVDQAGWALVQDLKQRGMLDDTLVIWGGEFGRTIYSQGKLTATDYGRDHHPRCFSLWMAGGGIKGGVSTAKRTNSPTTSSVTRSMCAISRPPSCTASASTTSGSRSNTKVSINA